MILQEIIYLAGNISDDPETYHWRERFEDYIDDLNQDLIERGVVALPVFFCLNPCSNSFNEEWKEKINIMRHSPSDHLGLLMPKDYHMIKRATIIVTNYDLCTTERPMVGSIFENTWADSIFRLPHIQIVGDKSSPYTRHQWIQDTASAKVHDEKEAVQVIAYFFAPKKKRTVRRARDHLFST
ncbi:MAG: hypothetical protein GQ553_04545 [Nitrosomonadaceae bacterium]|nr:hypothetical protein [Nitrosomonadaceae bacterium]